MNKTNKKYLYKLLEVASPSGFESKAQEITREYLKDSADEMYSDINGNLIAMKEGSGNRKIMIVGHADEIGFMINYIDESLPEVMGGLDPNLLPGLP